MEFQLNYFKSWKMMLWKCCTQYTNIPALENSAMATGLEIVSFHCNAKECSIVLILHTNKVMLKLLQARLQQYVNRALPDVKAELRRQRTQRSNCQHPLDHRKKQENSGKIPTSALLSRLKPLTVWIETNCGKFLKRWECQATLPGFRETCMQVKKQQLEPDMNNGLVQNWKISMSRLYIVTLI